MAAHEDAGASEKKTNDGGDDIPTFNAENLQSNLKIIYYSRTFLSIIGGVVAGILGLTGLTGFVFYFLIMSITSLGLVVKAKFSVHSYFDGWNRIVLDGFLGGLMSFVLFWTASLDRNMGATNSQHKYFMTRDSFLPSLSSVTGAAFGHTGCRIHALAWCFLEGALIHAVDST